MYTLYRILEYKTKRETSLDCRIAAVLYVSVKIVLMVNLLTQLTYIDDIICKGQLKHPIQFNI